MSLYPSIWQEGQSTAKLYEIPEEWRCEDCRGSGESMSKHQFGKGWSHCPCWTCGGSGLNKLGEQNKDKIKSKWGF